MKYPLAIPALPVAVWLAACAAPGDDRSDLDPGTVTPSLAVETDSGAVRGIRDDQTWAYRGIPYAAAPVGERRWRAPQPAPAWTGVRDASEFGPPCIQITTDLSDPNQVSGGQEDCLTLNVWTPEVDPAEPLPVMVFIHGGYFLSGSSSETYGGELVYDGSSLAARGPAIVVTLNYRLGALGFLAQRDLVAADPDRRAGNYGLLDQIAALEWVQRNIGQFGGDPGRVMIFGESAGGYSVCYLLVSPLARGLFSRALIQSGGCAAVPRADAIAAGDDLTARVGCAGAADVAACLRAVDAAEIATALPLAISTGGYWFGPNVDPGILRQPRAAIRDGEHAQVPTIIGTNRDEYLTLLGDTVAEPIVTYQDYASAVHDQLGRYSGDLALAEYPVADYPSAERAFVALMGDWSFHCPTRDIARVQSGAQAAPVWRYLFSYRYTQKGLRRWGAGHGMELISVFRVFDEPSFPDGPSDEDLAISDEIIGYWTRFAATGDPGGDAEWPRYEPSSDRYLDLDREIAAGDGLFTDTCDFWDALATGQL